MNDVQSLADRSVVDSFSGLDARRLVESLPHMVWVKGPDGATEYLSPPGAAFVGRLHEDTDGWAWLDLVHPDDVDVARRSWAPAIRESVPYEADFRLRRADGEYRWVASRGAPLFANDGTVQSWVGTWTDIDDRIASERELRCTQSAAAREARISETLRDAAPVGLGFVDRDCRIIQINETLAAINGGRVPDQLGRTVAEVIPEIWPHVESFYRRALDDGASTVNCEICGPTAEEPGRIHHWLANYYPVRLDEQIIGAGVVLVDVTESVEAKEALVALTGAAVNAIAAAAEARDPYTAGHQRRVAELAAAISSEMGLDPRATEGIRLAASIHDIGKISTPSEILSKPGKLSNIEFALVKEHAQAGHDIVQGIAFPWPVAEMIRQHHERMDGSGYPSGLAGAQIILGARVIAVADVVEAMASHRPYRSARGIDDALSQIERDRGSLLDAEVVDACLRLFRDDRFRFERQARTMATTP